MSVFTDNLDRLLKKNGITKKKMQQDLHLSANAIQAWKQRGNIPRQHYLRAIADYFGVTVEYLTTPHDPDEYDKDKALVDRIVQQVKAEIKNPTADISSERQKIIDMVSGLDEERLKEVKSYLEYLASKDK